MNKKTTYPAITARFLLIATASTLSACVAGGPGVSQYGMGSDRAAIADARTRSDAVISRSELQNNRMQRADVSEEIDLDQKKKNASINNAVAPLQGVAQGMDAIRSILRPF